MFNISFTLLSFSDALLIILTFYDLFQLILKALSFFSTLELPRCSILSTLSIAKTP